MYKACIYYVMRSSSEDDSTRRGVGSAVFLNGFGGVGPVYGFTQNPFTFYNKISPAKVPSVNVPFFVATIQYGPGQRKLLEFSGHLSHACSTLDGDPRMLFSIVAPILGFSCSALALL